MSQWPVSEVQTISLGAFWIKTALLFYCVCFCSFFVFFIALKSNNYRLHIIVLMCILLFWSLVVFLCIKFLFWLCHCTTFVYCIDFKVLLLVYKSLNGLGPKYIADMLTEYKPNRPLRSLGSSQLEMPRVHTKQGESAFSYYAARSWNQLPEEIRCAKTFNPDSKLICLAVHLLNENCDMSQLIALYFMSNNIYF